MLCVIWPDVAKPAVIQGVEVTVQSTPTQDLL